MKNKIPTTSPARGYFYEGENAAHVGTPYDRAPPKDGTPEGFNKWFWWREGWIYHNKGLPGNQAGRKDWKPGRGKR